MNAKIFLHDVANLIAHLCTLKQRTGSTLASVCEARGKEQRNSESSRQYRTEEVKAELNMKNPLMMILILLMVMVALILTDTGDPTVPGKAGMMDPTDNDNDNDNNLDMKKLHGDSVPNIKVYYEEGRVNIIAVRNLSMIPNILKKADSFVMTMKNLKMNEREHARCLKVLCPNISKFILAFSAYVDKKEAEAN